MQIPNISDYIDCQSYFCDFYESSKKQDESVSFRTLGKQLDWPHSYISDLIHGRKTLTISRALEFASFAKLNLVETERLIYMALRWSGDSDVRNFFGERLRYDLNGDSSSEVVRRRAGYSDESKTTIEELKNDLSASALLKFLGAQKGPIKPEHIGKLFFSFPELSVFEAVEEKILKLQKNGNLNVINLDRNIIHVEVLRPTIFFEITKENLSNMTHFLDNMSRIMRHPKTFGNFNEGYVNIPKSDLKNVVEKISILRNYLLELDKKASREDNNEESLLFQYDLNLATLVDIKQLGINSFRDWGELGND